MSRRRIKLLGVNNGTRKKIEINLVDDVALTYMDLDALIEHWNSSLPPMVDYAEMVGAPDWAYGCKYVYEDSEGYFIEDTIAALKELKELREIVKDTITQIEINNQKLLNMIHTKNVEE